MTPQMRQICIADDKMWESVKAMFSQRGIMLFRIPDFDEGGTESYGLIPVGL